jgi:hypothetical protein
MDEQRSTFGFGDLDAAGLVASINGTLEGGGVEVDEDHVRVTLGRAPLFDVSIPRASIRRVEELPDGSVTSTGVHGAFGKWLVNRSSKGLVRLDIRPPARASMNLGAVTTARLPRPISWLLRQRTVKLRRLTLSLDDPRRFIDSLS